jgi:hypothetical protein
LLGLSGRFERRVVTDGVAGEPAANCVDRTTRQLKDRPPGGLEGHCPSRLGEDRIEAADSRLGTCSGDTLDEPRETIKPR